MDDYVTTSEIEYIVENFSVSSIEDIGTSKWFERVRSFSKLYGVALQESGTGEERVKTAVLHFDKLNRMIEEIIVVSYWKDFILKLCYTMKGNVTCSFPCYLILQREMMLVGVLQNVLFKSEAFHCIEDRILDLIDYAVKRVTNLIKGTDHLSLEDIRDKVEDHLKEAKAQDEFTNFHIGSSCLTILRYVAENLSQLPLNAGSRIYTTHDVPVLVTHLIEQQTWTKHLKGIKYKFQEIEFKQWRSDDPFLSKTECQAWLLIRQLLLNDTCNQMYTFSEYRSSQLSSLLKYLHDGVLDQLSVLADLKHYLHLLQIRSTEKYTTQSHNPLIMEISETLVDSLHHKYKDRVRDLAEDRFQLLFQADQQKVSILAKHFVDTFEPLTGLVDRNKICSFCMNRAEKRCSKCKNTWYCSRQCQVQHWPSHKPLCQN